LIAGKTYYCPAITVNFNIYKQYIRDFNLNQDCSTECVPDIPEQFTVIGGGELARIVLTQEEKEALRRAADHAMT